MKKAITFAFIALALTGCGEEKPTANTSSANSTNQQEIAAELAKGNVKVADGTVLSFPNSTITSKITQNSLGKYQRYSITTSQDIMKIEGEVFSTLAKAGYVRTVKKEEAGLYSVQYAKKGYPAMGANYTTLSDGSKSELTMHWKIESI